MKRKISELLEEGLDRELDKLPYGLSKRQMKRLTDKALDRVIKRVSRKLGIANANVENIKQIFRDCNQSFPNFEDECYIQAMKSAEGGRIVQLGFYETINKPRVKEKEDFTNDILFEDEWGANYDPLTKTMFGGYSEDGKHFHPIFRVTDVEEDNFASALAMCVHIHGTKKLNMIDANFYSLMELYQRFHFEKVQKVTSNN